MKKIELNNYLANVTCPYCCKDGAGAIFSTPWNVGDVLYVFQRCEICERTWKEEWQLAKVEIGETEDEKAELDFLHRHPEGCQ